MLLFVQIVVMYINSSVVSFSASMMCHHAEKGWHAGLHRGGKHEPSFARGPTAFACKAPQSGEFIVRGADGRGGRATVLKPSNRQAAPVQVRLNVKKSCLSS